MALNLMMSWLMIVLVGLPKKLLSQSSPDITMFNFTAFDGTEADLLYRGDAHIPSNRPSQFIRLTATRPPNATYNEPTPLQNRVGRVLYSPPIRLWDRAGRRQANFQTVIKGFIGNPWTTLMGDGMAFFIVPYNTGGITIPSGSMGGNLGLYDGSTGTSIVPLFSVELDVFVNTWDPNYRHVGINVNSRNSVAVARWDSGVGFGRNIEARITYDARARLISVVAIGHSTLVPINATVEYALDLKTIFPEWVQIGISASTGQGYSAYHDIHTWSFISFMSPDDDTPNYIRQFV